MRDLSSIGRKVNIIDKESMYYSEWGTVQAFDGEYYHVAIANDTDCVPIFLKDQLEFSKTRIKLTTDKMVEIDMETGNRID
jgi:hypothetical protein